MKFTVDEVLQALKESRGGVYLAAEKLNCHHQTIYNYQKKYKRIANYIKSSRERELDNTVKRLHEKIDDGDTTAIIFHLKTIGKKRGFKQEETKLQLDLFFEVLREHGIGEAVIEVLAKMLRSRRRKKLGQDREKKNQKDKKD